MSVGVSVVDRAQGCLVGQFAGDSLGSLVEFGYTPETIKEEYPNGVREMKDGGPLGLIAGQLTDDSEMALMLVSTLLSRGTYDPNETLEAYRHWLNSNPFDVGFTTSTGLSGELNYESQANGALMRISPLGIFGTKFDSEQVAEWARMDAELTHPHPICPQANALFARAIAKAIKHGTESEALYQDIVKWAEEDNVEPELMETIKNAKHFLPEDYVRQQGWVLIALQNALHQTLNAPNPEEGIVDTISRGGDTDTNAAICGALLGAIHGLQKMPEQWIQCQMNCRPEAGQPNVMNPRPKEFWPVDVLELAEKLVG